MYFCRAAVIATICLIAFAGVARADDVAAAKMHYERGTTLFDLQRYLEAAKEYEAAFEAKNDPALLFNIAQAYRFGGDYSKAIAAYRSFLRRMPDADNRPEIEKHIAELQRISEEQKHNVQSPPTGTLKPGEKKTHEANQEAAKPVVPLAGAAAAPVREKPRRATLISGIVLGAVGIVAIAVGGAFEGLAASTNSSLSHPVAGTPFDPQKEKMLKTDEAAGAVMLSVGGAALVTGTVLTIIGFRERHSAVAVVPSVSPNHVGAVVNASF